MSNSENKKALLKVNENSFLYKIRGFFAKIFKEKNIAEEKNIETQEIKTPENLENKSKNIEYNNYDLKELHKKYSSGELKESDMTQEQVNALNEWYKNQIAFLRKDNEIRKEKLKKFRENLSV